MTDEAWKEEVHRVLAALTVVAQALIDENYDIVRCLSTNGVEFTGVQVGNRVIISVLPDDGQEPMRPEGAVIQ